MAGTQTDNLLLLDLTTGLARTTETGGTPDVINTSVDWEWVSGANVVIDGNLTVNGTTTTINTEQVNVKDNYMYLNDGYTATSAITGGFVVNVLATATVDTVAATGFVAGVAAVSNPTVITTGSATFSVGDIIQISDADNQSNDGIFEVLSHVGTLLTIRGIGTASTTQDWPQNQFTTDTTVAGTITVVNVSVFCATSTGDWLVATTNTTTGIVYETITTQGLVDLQVAYIAGNTITTSGGEGNVTFAGTETFVITTGGGVNLDAPFDFDSTSFDVQMTGTNGFSIDGTAASNVSATSGDLTLSTITSGALIGTSAAGIDLNATTTVTIDTADATDASGNDITITAGTSTAGTAAGASIILTPGDGNTTGVAGSVDVTGPNNEDEAIFSLETTGTNGDKIEMYVGDSSPSGSVTALAGSLFFRDTGAGAELWLNTSAGSGTTWTQLSTAAGATLQSAYEAGNTITTSGAEGNVTINGTEDFLVGGSVTVNFDTTDAISLDANVASNFTVDSAPLTLSTTTSGLLSVTSAGILDLDAGDNAAGTGNAVTIDAGDSGGGGGLGGAILLTAGSGDGTATGGNIDLLAGSSGAGATGDGADVTATGGAALSTNGDGGDVALTTGAGSGTGSAGTISLTGPNTEGQALLSLATTGTGGDTAQLFVGDSSPNGSVTADAGSLFLRDTATDGELWINTSTGSGTTWRQVVTSGAGGALSLQEAYIGGNTIVTSGGEGILDISGTETISLDAGAASNFTVAGANLTLNTTGSGNVILASAGLVDIDSGSSVDILASTTFSIDGTGASNVSATSGSLTLSTITSGSLIGTSAADIDFNATTSFTLDTLDATDASTNDITLTAGSSTAGGADGASIILTPGDGNVAGVAGAVVITGPNDEDEALVTLTTAGTSGDSVGLFVGDNDPSATITADAGSLFFRDTGAGAELYLNTSTGSGTSWTALSTGGSVTLQNAYINGNTITTSGGEGNITFTGTEDFVVTTSDMLVDTTASISLDADTASNFTVAGANLTLETTGSGTLDLNSAADIDITFATANATALVIDDGSTTYMTFDSTVAEPAVAVSEFLDIVGSGAGVTLTAGEILIAGAVVTIEGTTGDVILADSNTGTTLDGLAIGIAAYGAADTAPVKVYTVPGSLIPVNFAAAPAAALNGRPVFVSQTPGQGITTAPTGSGNVVYIVGILQGADGASTSPLVMYQPQFIAVRP
jgi:hypothetical protein